jgi:UDP-N-acetylglucosamine 2-epimerase (non-hydrolysing)
VGHSGGGAGGVGGRRRVRLLHVVGARPNFPKLAPVHRAALDAGLRQHIVHTGQHYSDGLSAVFFEELGIPEPDVNLGVGSASHAVQTARIMERLEPVLEREKADWVVVYGDVNSTMAAAIVAVKLGIPIAHVEAGLRSHDWTMPEEVNRVVTDRLASLLLTPSRDADQALRREGEPDSEIVFVGNVMIDSLFYVLQTARRSGFRRALGVDGDAVVVTLHRPSNVDEPNRLRAIAQALREVADERPVVFPVHPRTRARIAGAGVSFGRVTLLEPLRYVEMLDLVDSAHAVVTDSGGLQEETTAIGVPCFTLRPNTERPITLREGTNELVPDPSLLPEKIRAARRPEVPRRPEGWDGRAGERAVRALIEHARPAQGAAAAGSGQSG